MDRKRILIVDDEKGFTSMLSLNLEATGDYEVCVENDSTRALSAAVQYSPHLILLDVIMPKMEGPDVAIALKEHNNLKKIPIVFLTATVTKEEVVSQGGRIGGHPFVAKPSTLGDLLESIEKNMVSVL